jgi:hypothetical protein
VHGAAAADGSAGRVAGAPGVEFHESTFSAENFFILHITF